MGYYQTNVLLFGHLIAYSSACRHEEALKSL